jgi:hypothetical protein
MHHKFTNRQRVICGIIAFCAAVAYICFCMATISLAWQRKEGDIPAVSSWLVNLCFDLSVFPFGYIPGIDGIWMLILNALFWSTVSALIYVLFCRRKVAA